VNVLNRRFLMFYRGPCFGEWGRGEGGAKSYDSEEAWSSINHSILSGCLHFKRPSSQIKEYLNVIAFTLAA
jgi:hypothetical protein